MSLLAITRAAGMTAAYGSDGYARILSKIADYQQANPGVTLAILDDPNSMASFGGPAAGADASSLQTAVARAAQATGSTALLILGGASIVPLYQIPNPVADRAVDPDRWVYTDNPYGVRGSYSLAGAMYPDLPVGRICTGAGDPASAFGALIDSMIANRTARPVRAGYVEVTNRAWENFSASVASALAGSGQVLVCPNDAVTSTNASVLDCKFLYCNLHGFLNDPGWKGQDPVRGYVTALSPASFASPYVSGGFVYTDACYGLQTFGRPTSGSCALTLLAQGAAAVIGSTGFAFGTAPGAPLNLMDADLMTRTFFSAALAGATVGKCLQTARRSLTGADVYQQKTLLQFQLLGDPTLGI